MQLIFLIQNMVKIMSNTIVNQIRNIISKYTDVSKVDFHYCGCDDIVNVYFDHCIGVDWIDSEKFRTDIHGLYWLLDWMFDYDGRLLTIYVDKDLL